MRDNYPEANTVQAIHLCQHDDVSDGDEKARLQVWIPRPLMRRLRVAAALLDTSTTALVAEFIDEGLERRRADLEAAEHD